MSRVVALQCLIFTVEWALMLAGFGLIVEFIVPLTIIPETTLVARYVDAGIQALLGLLFSTVWLYVWDRQVRILFFREKSTVSG